MLPIFNSNKITLKEHHPHLHLSKYFAASHMCRTVVYYAKTCRMIFFQPTLLVKNIAKNKSPPKLEAKAIEKVIEKY